MLDIAPTELLLVAFVALVVIGPKDLPKALRVLGYWTGKARGVARQFRAGFDEMVREAEVAEMEKRWAAENERIMREHPQGEDAGGVAGVSSGATEPTVTSPVEAGVPIDHPSVVRPIMVEKPVVAPAEGGATDDGPADRVAS